MSDVKIYYDADVDAGILEGKKMAVIGYGAQGRAQARMMHEAGVDVVVGVRKDGASWKKVQEDGLKVMTIEEASRIADVVHILIPDECQKKCFNEKIVGGLEDGNVLSFSHGFAICYGQIVPPEGVSVIMVAPKSPGTEEYKCFQEDKGVPALISARVDKGGAKEIALAMAKKMKFTKAGVMECTFEQEAYEDLFGEQAVLCGGVVELIKSGFEVLIEGGYPPELAYFECLHEMKLIVDLLQEGGIERMYEVVSNTAEFGGHTRGHRVLGEGVKERMRKILDEVEDGTFAKEWIAEAERGGEGLREMRRKQGEHPIEVVGKKIRGMFGR